MAVREQGGDGAGHGHGYVARVLVLSAVVMVAYVQLPTVFGESLFHVVAWGSVIAVLIGVRRHGARSIAWKLLAAGFALFVGGDLLFTVYEDVLHETPFPSYADVLYIAGYPLIASGLALLARRSRSTRGHSALIDAGIIVVPAAVAAWIYLIDPVATDSGLSFLERTVSAAYPIGDVLCLAVLIRLLILVAGTRSSGQPALGLLVAGFVVMLAADTWFLVATLEGIDTDIAWLDAVYMLPYIGVGAGAAGHPSIRRVGAPLPPQPTSLSRRRLFLLANAALVTPVLLWVRWITDEPLAVPLIVAGTIVSFLLAVARMSGLLDELEASRAALHFEATHDMLTGLPNRQEFDKRFTRVLADGGSGGLLFIDLDHFKEINDNCGHQTGDEVLIEVARRLRHAVRPHDVAARLAGDEFVVLTEAGETESLIMADRLLGEIGTARSCDGRDVQVTASIGVVRWPRNTSPLRAPDLLNAADRAMYEAKSACGNQMAVRLAG